MADEQQENLDPSAIKLAKNLDTASGVFFFLGIVLCKSQVLLQFFLPSIIGPIVNGIGLGFYWIGYKLWLLECYKDPRKRQQKDKWYGLASVGQQFTVSSIIGLVATALGIAGIFLPFLLLPTCWLFTLSNIIWCVGEYQKLQHNFGDPNYNETAQRAYFQYVVVITLISLLSSTLTTFAIFFPPFLPIALILWPYLGGIAIKAYLDINVLNPKKKEMKHVETHSEDKLAELVRTPSDESQDAKKTPSPPPPPNSAPISKRPVSAPPPGAFQYLKLQT